jgi:hypothetical protein
MLDQLPPGIVEFIDGVNAFDIGRVMATFADDALVNDNHREFWGKPAIQSWVASEMVGDHVTIEVTEVIDHRGMAVVRGRYDGEYDKTGLPDELIGTNYFEIEDGKIARLFVIFNSQAPH